MQTQMFTNSDMNHNFNLKCFSLNHKIEKKETLYLAVQLQVSGNLSPWFHPLLYLCIFDIVSIISKRKSQSPSFSNDQEVFQVQDSYFQLIKLSWFLRKLFCMNCRKTQRMILQHYHPGSRLEAGLICGLTVGLNMCVKFP